MNVDEIRAAAIAHGEAALRSARHRLGEDAWSRLGDWVEDYVVELARLWAIEASKGRRA